MSDTLNTNPEIVEQPELPEPPEAVVVRLAQENELLKRQLAEAQQATAEARSALDEERAQRGQLIAQARAENAVRYTEATAALLEQIAAQQRQINDLLGQPTPTDVPA